MNRNLVLTCKLSHSVHKLVRIASSGVNNKPVFLIVDTLDEKMNFLHMDTERTCA